jgi:protein SCO1/2
MSEQTETPRRSMTVAAFPALAAAALAGLSVLALIGHKSGAPPSAPRDCLLGANAAAIGGPIRLLDHNGIRVTEADFLGQPTIVYFGYAFCPTFAR